MLGWLGNKRKVSPFLNSIIPGDTKQIFEPFCGSMSFSLYHLQYIDPYKRVFASDINSELMNFYKQVYYHPDKLQNMLKKLKHLYESLDYDGKKDMYYQNRMVFNFYKIYYPEYSSEYRVYLYTECTNDNPYTIDSNGGSKIEQAARFYFLNKTCFKNLYRENQKGEFNVPFGDRKSFHIYDLKYYCQLFYNTYFLNLDYKELLRIAGYKDLVYVDPPYKPMSKNTQYVAYSKNKWSDTDHQELYENLSNLTGKGVYVMLSGQNVDYLSALYKDWNIMHLNGVYRGIGSRSKDEIVLTNF